MKNTKKSNDMDDEIIIKLSDIKKTYNSSSGTFDAVNSVSISVKKGEIYGIIGFSGAGKSTLLRCINLLEKPTSGEVYVNSQNLLNLRHKDLLKSRRNIGMIFQHFNLIANSTVYENVSFPLEISGIKKKDRKDRIKDSLEIVDIADKADTYPAKLSGGQKQRVAIARAMAMKPEILLCDEPTSALDPQTTDTIIKYLKHINEVTGTTIVIVTHEMETARKLCHRIGVMEKGKLIETLDMKEKSINPKSAIGQYLFGDGEGI